MMHRSLTQVNSLAIGNPDPNSQLMQRIILSRKITTCAMKPICEPEGRRRKYWLKKDFSM